MIRTYTLDCHASNPQMPLEPVCPYTGSAATFVLVNLPLPHGKQRIDAVTLSITNADAAVSAHPATRDGSSWIVTVPASAIGPAGNVREAIIISASGVDEQNRPVPSWIIGAADLRVRHQDGTAVPGEPRVLISWFESRPANPRGVFICPAQPPETGLDLYDGHNYRPLVGGGTDISGKLPMRALPKYLHAIPFDDTYPADAAWLYAQLGPSDLGRCSAVRRGGKLYRNYDWTFDDAAEFVVKMSGNASRFASVGVASVGSRLTENDVMSAVKSRYYKCLPGMTLDGINEKGVVCEINVDGGPKTGWHGTGANALHILAAVRWVLDHGETAEQAAEHLAENIIQPQGEMNFHFMVADADETWIVENGVAHNVTDGTKVLTNYALYDEAHAGGGKERYTLLAGGADISAVNFTNAYQSGNNWDSDFESAEQHAAAIEQWAAQGTDREAHRGKTTSSGKAWWQSVHTTEYDFAAKTMKVAVQEVDDWYVFAVDQANVDLTPIEAQIAALQDGKRDKTDRDTYTFEWQSKIDISGFIDDDARPVFCTIADPSRGIPANSWNCGFGEDGSFQPSAAWSPQAVTGLSGDITEITFTGINGEGARVPVVFRKVAVPSGKLLAADNPLPASGSLAKFAADCKMVKAEPSGTSADPSNADYRDPQDNTCHKTEYGAWVISNTTVSGLSLWFDKYGSGYWTIVLGSASHSYVVASSTNDDENANTVYFDTFDENIFSDNPTATRSSVCADGEKFVTFDIVTALVDGVKTLLGTVASPFSTFAEWIASKFDAAKAVPAFAETSTYEVGEIVMHDGTTYKCTTAVTTAGSWTGSTNWTASTDADLAARLKNLKSDGFTTDAFATDLLGKQVAIQKIDERLPIPISAKNAGFTTESYKRFVVTVGGNMTVTLHKPTGTDADVFECRFDGSGLSADASITFAKVSAFGSADAITTMDTNCGTVTAGKVALMSAFWNGATWDVNWKVEG